MLEGMMGNSLLVAGSSIILNQEVDLHGTSKVEIFARVSEKQPGLEMVEHSVDDWREEHPVLEFMVSLVHVVGSAIDAYDAYK